jgi:hypothetical protein
MKHYLEIASGILALVAAGLWLKSSLVKIPRNFQINVTSEATLGDVRISDRFDSSRSSAELVELAQRLGAQGAWSAWAAGFAAAAAFAQSLAAMSG